MTCLVGVLTVTTTASHSFVSSVNTPIYYSVCTHYPTHVDDYSSILYDSYPNKTRVGIRVLIICVILDFMLASSIQFIQCDLGLMSFPFLTQHASNLTKFLPDVGWSMVKKVTVKVHAPRWRHKEAEHFK